MITTNDYVVCIRGSSSDSANEYKEIMVAVGEVYQVVQSKFNRVKNDFIIQLKGRPGLWYSASRFKKLEPELAKILYDKE
jgi:inorganic pyrophosphatase/exopolyphosphatase